MQLDAWETAIDATAGRMRVGIKLGSGWWWRDVASMDEARELLGAIAKHMGAAHFDLTASESN